MTELQRHELIHGLRVQAALLRSNAQQIERLLPNAVAHHALELRGAAKITEDWIVEINKLEVISE